MPIIIDPQTGQRKFVADTSGGFRSPTGPSAAELYQQGNNAPVDIRPNEFTKGLRSGIEQVQGLGNSALAAGAALVGADDYSEEQTQQANQNFQRAGRIGPRVTDFNTATESPENFADFLKGGIGQAVPTFATAAVGGLAGVGVKSLLKSGVSNTVAGAGGAFAATEGMEAGGIFNEVVNDPEARRNKSLSELAGISFVGAAPAAALDTLPLMIAARRFGLGFSARKEITSKLKELGKGIGAQALIEGSTEAAQTVIERATHNFVNKHFEILGPEGVNEILGAGTIGAAFGGIVGGASVTPGIIGSRMAELDQESTDKVSQAEATFDKLRKVDDEDVQEYLDGIQDLDLADIEVQDDLDSVLKDLNLRRPKFTRNVSDNSKIQAAEAQLLELRAIRDRKFLTPDGKSLINTPEALAFQGFVDSQTRNFMNLRERVSDTRDDRVVNRKFQRTARANRSVFEASKRIGEIPRDAEYRKPVTKPNPLKPKWAGPVTTTHISQKGNIIKEEPKETPISRRKKPPIIDKTADIKAGIKSLDVPEKVRVGKLTAGNIKKDAIYGREIDEQTAQFLASVFSDPSISDANKRTLAEEYLTHPEYAFGTFDNTDPLKLSEADARANDLTIKDSQTFKATKNNIVGDQKYNVSFTDGGPINKKTGKPNTATEWATERKAVLEADNPGFSYDIKDAFDVFAEQANTAFFAGELDSSRGDEIIRLAQDDNLRMRAHSVAKSVGPEALDTVQKVEQHLKGRKLILREKIESALDSTDKQALTGAKLANEMSTEQIEARARAFVNISERKAAALGDPASVHSQTQAELTQVEKIWEQVKDKDSNPLSSQGAVDIAIELEVKSTDNRKTNQRLVREAVEAKLFSVQQAMKTTEVAIAETQTTLLRKDREKVHKNKIIRKPSDFTEKGEAWFAAKGNKELSKKDYSELRSIDRTSRTMVFGKNAKNELIGIRPHAMIQQNFQDIFGGQDARYDRNTIRMAYNQGEADLIANHGIIIDKKSLTDDVILFTDASKHPWTIGEVNASTEIESLTKAKKGVEILIAREELDEKQKVEKIAVLKVRLLEITRSLKYAEHVEREAKAKISSLIKTDRQIKQLAYERLALENSVKNSGEALSRILLNEPHFSGNLISVMNDAKTTSKIKKPSAVSAGPLFDALPAYTGDTNTYAGVGSRNTPPALLQVMSRVAQVLGKNGKHLNTGDAQGADTAFTAGARGNSTVFVPADTTERTKAIAKEIHPKPNALRDEGARSGLKLMARNTNQIFGRNLDTPVDFLIAWSPNGETRADQRVYIKRNDPRNTGGTGQAIALAELKGIPVINMKNKGWLAELGKVAGLSKEQLDFIRGSAKTAVSKPIRFQNRISRQDLKDNPDILYVFGDNMARTGLGGQAKEMRGEPNAVGVPTKVKPAMNAGAFMSDDKFAAYTSEMKKDIDRLQDHINKGGIVTFPTDGIGTGRAQLKERAPKINQWLRDELNKIAKTKPEASAPVATATTNIYSGTKENAGLSNFALRPFTWEGRKYFSVEHAYQTNKGGTFHQATYDAYKGAGLAKRGPVADQKTSIKLMEELMPLSFQENPDAMQLLRATGDTTLTHTQAKGIWAKEFPRILTEIRDNAQIEEPVSPITSTNGALLGDDYLHQSIHHALLETHIEAEATQLQMQLIDAQGMEIGRLKSISNIAPFHQLMENPYVPIPMNKFIKTIGEHRIIGDEKEKIESRDPTGLHAKNESRINDTASKLSAIHNNSVHNIYMEANQKEGKKIGMEEAEVLYDLQIARQQSLLEELNADEKTLISMVSRYTKTVKRLNKESESRVRDIEKQIKQHKNFIEQHKDMFKKQDAAIQTYATTAASLRVIDEKISTKNISYNGALASVRAMDKSTDNDVSIYNTLHEISPKLVTNKTLKEHGLTAEEYRNRDKSIDASSLIAELALDPNEWVIIQKSEADELIEFDETKTSGFANAAEQSAVRRLEAEITELENALIKEDLIPRLEDGFPMLRDGLHLLPSTDPKKLGTISKPPFADEDFADTTLANKLKAKKLEKRTLVAKAGQQAEPRNSVLNEQLAKGANEKGQGGQGPNAQRNVLGKLRLALGEKMLASLRDTMTEQEITYLEDNLAAQEIGFFIDDLKALPTDLARAYQIREMKKYIKANFAQVKNKLKPIVAAVKQIAGRIKSSAEVLSTEQAMKAFNMTRQQLLETNGMYFKGKIWVKENLSPLFMREVIAHELGHGIFENELRDASAQVQTAIRKQFDAWRKTIHGKSVHSVIQSKAAFNTAYKYITESTDRAVSSLSSEDQTYLLDFEEWFADQVAVWESSKPKTILEKFFKKIGDLIKKLMGRQTTDSVRDFLDSIEQRNWIPSTISRGRRFLAYARANKQITDNTLMSHLIKSAPNDMADIETLSNMLPSMFTKADLSLLGRAFTQGNVRSQLFKLYKPHALIALDESITRTVAAGLVQWAHGHLQVGPKVHSVYEKAMGKLATALKGKTDMQKQNAALDAIEQGKAIWGHHTDLGITTERTDAKKFKDVENIADLMGSLGSVFEKVFISANDQLYGTKNPALIKLAQMFHSRTGSRLIKQGYFQEKQRNVGRYLSSATNVLKPLSDEQKTKVLEDLRTGKHTSNEAAGMRKIFNAMYAYANNNGVKVKLRKNYVPRVWNKEEVAKRRSELEALLAAHGIKESEKAVDRLLGLEDREIEEWIIPYEPALGAAKERGLGEVPDTVLGEAGFLSNDLEYITVNYIESLVKRVEYTKRFGDGNEKIIEITKDAQKLGATEGDIELMHSYIQAMMGITGHETNQALASMLGLKAPPVEQKINPALQQVLSTVLVIRNLALLSLAMFTSLADPLGISVRSGSLTDTGVALKTGMNEIWNSVTGQKSQVHELANALGILESHMTNVALQWEYGGTYMAPWARKVNDEFFKWTGLTGLTRLTRSMALGASHSFIARHASNPNGSSLRYLEELNLTPDEVMLTPDGKSVRVLTFQERSKAPQHERDRDDKVRAAMNQFVDEAILRPNAAQRPIWASDPHYMLVFHLKAFMYSFHDRILRRAVTEMGEHNSVAPMVGLMMFVPALLFIDSLRDLIKHGGTPAYKQNWDTADYTFNAMERSGLFGIYQQGFDIRQAQIHGGSGLEGPLGGLMFPANIVTDPAKLLPFQNLRTE